MRPANEKRRYNVTKTGIPIINIKGSDGRLIFIMGILITGKTVFKLRRGHVEACGEHNKHIGA